VIFLENPDIKVPLPREITIDVPNNHLKYAITWYSIAISILLYYLYFRKKK
jgi:surfeit locus 1 family protein